MYHIFYEITTPVEFKHFSKIVLQDLSSEDLYDFLNRGYRIAVVRVVRPFVEQSFDDLFDDPYLPFYDPSEDVL